jgi:hypothetical protein
VSKHRGDVGARNAHHFEHVRVAADFHEVRILALPRGLALGPVNRLRRVVGADLEGRARGLGAGGEIRVPEMTRRQRADDIRGTGFDIETAGRAFVTLVEP